MQWLEHNLLGYLKEWEESVDKCTLDVPIAERPTMLLSKETREGINITG